MAKKETIENIEYDIADVIIGRPQEFKVGRKTFCFYPITLAKMLLLKRQLDCLELNMDILRANPFLEALRVMKEHRETVCTILSYMTAPNTYKDLYDSRALAVRRNVFNKDLGEEDLASLLVVSLDDKTDRIMRHLGLDKEHEKLQKVMKVKKKHDDNSLNFCGLSLFGTFIGQLKEMGYSDNEILYEKGYTYLRLLTRLYRSSSRMMRRRSSRQASEAHTWMPTIQRMQRRYGQCLPAGEWRTVNPSKNFNSKQYV